MSHAAANTAVSTINSDSVTCIRLPALLAGALSAIWGEAKGLSAAVAAAATNTPSVTAAFLTQVKFVNVVTLVTGNRINAAF
jgi:hypothetical protein